jgi:hypothetical protein
MAITYTWLITSIECNTPDADADCDIITSASWRLIGTDGDYSSFSFGTSPLNIVLEVTPGTLELEAYNALTEAEMITAVQTALGEEQITSLEAEIAERIQQQVAPTTISPPLPWVV